MFTEYWCGCIVSMQQGRIRICTSHRPDRADGRGAAMFSVLRGIKRYIPGNGEEVANWSGR